MTFSTDFSDLTNGDELSTSSNWTTNGFGTLDRWWLEKENNGTNNYLQGRRNTGNPANQQAYFCPDQSSADHYTAVKLNGLNDVGTIVAAVRLVDSENYAGFYLTGTGLNGLRMCKAIAGTFDDLFGPTVQGVSDEWVKIDADGTTYSLWQGGTGATPGTWVQAGSDQTIPDGDLSTAETSQGIAIIESVINNSTTWIQAFEAGALGAGGGTTVDGAGGLHTISRQFTTQAAARLGGVLQ